MKHPYIEGTEVWLCSRIFMNAQYIRTRVVGVRLVPPDIAKQFKKDLNQDIQFMYMLEDAPKNMVGYNGTVYNGKEFPDFDVRVVDEEDREFYEFMESMNLKDSFAEQFT